MSICHQEHAFCARRAGCCIFSRRQMPCGRMLESSNPIGRVQRDLRLRWSSLGKAHSILTHASHCCSFIPLRLQGGPLTLPSSSLESLSRYAAKGVCEYGLSTTARDVIRLTGLACDVSHRRTPPVVESLLRECCRGDGSPEARFPSCISPRNRMGRWTSCGRRHGCHHSTEMSLAAAATVHRER